MEQEPIKGEVEQAKVMLMPVLVLPDGKIERHPAADKLIDPRPFIERKPFLSLAGLLTMLAGLAAIMLPVLVWFILAAMNPPKVIINPTYRRELTYKATVPTSALTPIDTTFVVEASAPATGKLTLPDGIARANVRFLNSSPAPVYLAPGTVLFNRGNVSYKLEGAISVPAADFNTARFGVGAGVALASVPGLDGNGAGAVFNAYGLRVEVGTFTGGSTKTITIVTDADIAAVKVKLDEQSKAKAQAAISAAIPAGSRPTSKLEITQPEYQLPTPGAEAQAVTGRLVARANFTVFYPSQLLSNLPVTYNNPNLGEPIFKEFDDQTLTVTYTRPVNPATIQTSIENWQGSPAAYRQLITELLTRPEVESVVYSELPAAYGWTVKAVK